MRARRQVSIRPADVHSLARFESSHRSGVQSEHDRRYEAFADEPIMVAVNEVSNGRCCLSGRCNTGRCKRRATCRPYLGDLSRSSTALGLGIYAYMATLYRSSSFIDRLHANIITSNRVVLDNSRWPGYNVESRA